MKIFVTDGDNRASLAITRSLGARGHHVIVGEKRQPSLAQSSRFCSGSVVYPDPVTDSDRFVDFVASTVRQRGVEIVMPVADITTFLVTENRERFEPQCAVPFASDAIVQRAANKVDILQTAMRLGVPVPRSVLVCSSDCPPVHDLEFPLVVKPRQSRVRVGSAWLSTSVSYARNAEALQRDLRSRGAHEFPLMLQECIEGPGVGVFACYHGGRPSALFSHRRIRERPPSGGVSVLSESTALDPMARDYAVRLLDEIKWHGVAMVEFKRDHRDGVPKLMEINGRFWGSLQLAIDAGVDFPGLLVEGVQTETMPPPAPYRLGVRNRWFWGDVDSLLLTVVGGHVSPKGQQAKRARAILDFLKLWGKDLYYESPKASDLRPWLLETRRWIGKGLGEGRRASAPAAGAPSVAHAVAVTPPVVSRVPCTAPVSAGLDARIDPRCLTPEYQSTWNALLATSDTSSVFQTHEWNRSWWETFQEPLELCAVTVQGPNGVTGIAPLVVARSGSRDHVVRFLGDGRSDYCDFLTGANKDEALRAMFNTVFSSVGWDIIELNNVPAESRTTAIAQAACSQAGYKMLVVDQFVCPTLIIGGREDEARAILNKPSLRRPTNYFQRAGRLVCRNLTEAEAIEPQLEQFFDQHVERWSGSHSPSLFLKQRNRAFYRALTRRLGPSGTLLFSVIELDDRPIAFHYGFDFNGAVIWYKPSFEQKYAAHSPGLVMVRHLIDHAIAERKRELDFTVGDEPFKRRFTNLTRKTVSLVVFRDSRRYMLEAARRRIATAVKPRPANAGVRPMKVTS